MGTVSARRVWKDYFPAVDAIVFLVDANDRARFEESKQELVSLLTDETLSTCPVLILGNKIDLPGAASEDELRMYYDLYGQSTGKVKKKREGEDKGLSMMMICRGRCLGRTCRRAL